MKLNELTEAVWRGNRYGDDGYNPVELQQTGRDPQESVWRSKVGRAENILYQYATGEKTPSQVRRQLKTDLDFGVSDLRNKFAKLIDLKSGREFEFKW